MPLVGRKSSNNNSIIEEDEKKEKLKLEEKIFLIANFCQSLHSIFPTEPIEAEAREEGIRKYRV